MMTRSLFVLLALGTIAAGAAGAAPRTLRVDYYHTGNAREERFSLDRVVREPLPWTGNPDRPLDDSNLGKYFFEVLDPATNTVLYSRGFSSIYGEWETTSEAKAIDRTFQESLRFPDPGRPVQIVVKKRDARNLFREVCLVAVDPRDRFVDTAPPPPAGPLVALQRSGDPADKVDLLILGDGYTEAERPKFEADARRLTEILFSKSPFRERRDDFNVWGLSPAAVESGISRPSTGVHRRSPVGATYDAFGSERYVLTFDNRAFRDLASQAPYEVVEILVNGATYGGGGIFGQYSTVAADSAWAPYIFVHEFGHHFAGLADEYYTSDVAYEPASDRTEPWEPNATALVDPARLKWGDLVDPSTPVPTPWPKEAFESYAHDTEARRRQIRAENRPEAEMDALFRDEQAHETQLLASSPFAGAVGAFEGAMYEARGYFRSEVDCIMFTRDEVPFCRVCQRAISRVIDLYATQR